MKKIKLIRRLFIIFLSILLVIINSPALAQEAEPDGPYYVVKEGDSLWDIALRFRVSLEILTRTNGISNPGQLTVGTRLVIPGYEGIQGELTTRTIAYGEALRALKRRYQISTDLLVQLNRLTSPGELYAGSTLILPQENAEISATQRAMLLPGQSLFELAVTNGTTPWVYVLANDLEATWGIVPGEVLHLPEAGSRNQKTAMPGALPEMITGVEINPLPLVQGKVTVFQVNGDKGLSLDGSLIGHNLHFFPQTNGGYVSLQGVHAMVEPGLYTLVISGTLPANLPYFNAPFSFSQEVLVRDGDYYFDPVLIVSPETIDPAVTKPEDAQWASLAAPVTPLKLWEGIFMSPAPDPYKECWPSLFGNRRSYNGSAYIYFHSGLDFCGGVGTEILAPTRGRVVFAGPLTVRGNATMIDHGWGIYTGYMHQSEIRVNVGDLVDPGQVIGLVGGTGRVTGPHLHWEVWAGGVQVDPLDWLESPFPN